MRMDATEYVHRMHILVKISGGGYIPGDKQSNLYLFVTLSL